MAVLHKALMQRLQRVFRKKQEILEISNYLQNICKINSSHKLRENVNNLSKALCTGMCCPLEFMHGCY